MTFAGISDELWLIPSGWRALSTTGSGRWRMRLASSRAGTLSPMRPSRIRRGRPAALGMAVWPMPTCLSRLLTRSRVWGGTTPAHVAAARSSRSAAFTEGRRDPDPAQPLDHRAVRGRQKLARVRAWAQGLPGGPLGPVLPRAAPVRGAGAGPRRRALRQALAPARPGQPAGARRLGPRAAVARAGARSPGDRRGSLRCRLAPDHEPSAGRPLVRHHRPSDARRCRARSRGPQRLSDRTLRREPAQTQGARTSATSGHLTFPSGIMIIHHDPRDGVALAAFKSEWWPASRRNSGRL